MTLRRPGSMNNGVAETRSILSASALVAPNSGYDLLLADCVEEVGE